MHFTLWASPGNQCLSPEEGTILVKTLWVRNIDLCAGNKLQCRRGAAVWTVSFELSMPPVMPMVRMEGHWFAHYCQLADKSWPA